MNFEVKDGLDWRIAKALIGRWRREGKRMWAVEDKKEENRSTTQSQSDAAEWRL